MSMNYMESFMNIKKLLPTALLLPLLLGVSVPSQAALDGDACIAQDFSTKATFRCSTIGNQGMTINELYQAGYRVVASYPNVKSGTFMIIIERQK